MISSGEDSITLVQGASRGLGLAFVKTILAKQSNASVIATCRNPDHAQSLIELKSVYENRLSLIAVDVTEEASVASSAESVAERVDHLDMLINCAGLLHEQDLMPERRLSEVNPENLTRYFAVNSIGSLLVAKHFAKSKSNKRSISFNFVRLKNRRVN